MRDCLERDGLYVVRDFFDDYDDVIENAPVMTNLNDFVDKLKVGAVSFEDLKRFIEDQTGRMI